MEAMTAAEARLRLGDEIALFDFGWYDYGRMVAAATDLLLADPASGPGVVALACVVVTPALNSFEMLDIVRSARDELGMPRLDADATTIRALQGMARRWLAGEMTDRELAEWAHRCIGHEGASEAQDVVVADDMFFEMPSTGMTEHEVGVFLREAVGRVLDLGDPWQPYAD